MRGIRKLQKKLLEYLEREHSPAATGMCNAVYMMHVEDIITREDYYELTGWLHEESAKRTVFYDAFGNKCSHTHLFWFPIGQLEPRIEWLKNYLNEEI